MVVDRQKLPKPTCANNIIAHLRHSSLNCQEQQTDTRQRFNTPFTHLHHAVFHFHPTIQVAMFLTYQGYPFTVTAKSDHCWKIHPQVSACAQQLQEATDGTHRITTVNISELLKAIRGRHSYFICGSSYLKISLRLICLWMWERHQYLNFLKDDTNWPMMSQSGDTALTNKLFSCPQLW